MVYLQRKVTDILCNVVGLKQALLSLTLVAHLSATPVITLQPTSQAVPAGNNVVFSLAATGNTPLSYQWYFNGQSIGSATSSSLSLAAVTLGSSGNYTALVTDQTGIITSRAATLTVTPPIVAPTIVTQPLSQQLTVGGNLMLSVVADGTGPLTYQWYFNGIAMAGASNSILAILNATLGNAGNYSVLVSNSAGSVASLNTTVTVIPVPSAPIITTQPVSQSVTVGDRSLLSVTASGATPISYQWFFNGVSIVGANSSTLIFNSVTPANAGTYTVLVSNAGGNTTSTPVVLTVNPAVPPTILVQPASQTAFTGSAVTLSVSASGTGPLSYQWYFNGFTLTGATNSSLALNDVGSQSAGIYSVLVSNSVGIVTSSSAILVVNPPAVAPAIVSLPVSQTVTSGSNVSFAVTASGTAPLNYQWYLNGQPLSGTNSNTLVLNNVSTENTGSYSVLVSNAVGIATSSVATLVVNPSAIAPTITLQPRSQTTIPGSSVTFTVAAGGTPPLYYQWYFNSLLINGATNSTLVVNNINGETAGNYSVLVSNMAGTVASYATLTVIPPTAPTITQQPTGSVVTLGMPVNLNLMAAGSPSPTIQWYLNGSPIAGATNAYLIIPATTYADAGSYTALVTNRVGSVLTSPASLTVTPACALSNLSVRTTIAANQTLIVGAVASGEKHILVRAGGPALNQFGLQGLADPNVSLYYAGVHPIAVNDDWPSQLAQTFTAVGAFPYLVNSKDAALSKTLSGAFTVQTRGTGNGTVLVEMYDTSGGTAARLVNVSARNTVGVGSDVLIAGFSITGSGSKQVLVRGIGPGLSQFGVTNALVDPKIQVHCDGVLLAVNDNWGVTLAPTFASVGAFNLPIGSKDAALMVTLTAGHSYTVQVSGAEGGIGEGLIEVYELP